MNGKPHQQKPDKDNLEKALLDAIFDDDSRVWDGRVTKVWGRGGDNYPRGAIVNIEWIRSDKYSVDECLYYRKWAVKCHGGTSNTCNR
ncbi:RusA family crossover junction endodeoxyribonuclease [Enterobacter hormaechei]